MEEGATEEKAEGVEVSDEGLTERCGGGPPLKVCPPPSGTPVRRVLGNLGPLRAPSRDLTCILLCGAWIGSGGLHIASWPTRKQCYMGGGEKGEYRVLI